MNDLLYELAFKKKVQTFIGNQFYKLLSFYALLIRTLYLVNLHCKLISRSQIIASNKTGNNQFNISENLCKTL